MGWSRSAAAIAAVTIETFFCATAAGAFTDTGALMALPGAVSVDDAANLNYELRLFIPPGSSYIRPALTLDYGSASGGDLLGPGWSLRGLSTVERCPAKNDAPSAANPSDRYCLDGQRLVAVKGAYGADGTEYRTELDTRAHIVSHGRTGDGPSWFEVGDEHALLMQLGNSPDSRETAATGVRRWRLNRKSDPFGTYFAVSYAADAREGTVHPVQIDYSGNDTLGLKTYNTIAFSYEDAPASADGRSPARALLHLTRIKIAADGDPAEEYRVGYDAAGYLSAITRCDGQDRCLVPLSFGWESVGKPRYGTAGSKVVLLSSASNGIGAEERFAYAQAPAPAVGTARPQFADLAAYPDYVLSRRDQDNGIGGRYVSLYVCEDGRMDPAGRGFAGFGKCVISDPQTGRGETLTFSHDWPTLGSRISETIAYGATVTKRVVDSYSSVVTAPGVVLPYVSWETVDRFDLDGTPLPSVVTTHIYDGWGNDARSTVAWSDGWSKTTDDEFRNGVASLDVGYMTRTVVHVDSATSHLMRTSSFDYDTHGALTQEVIEPDTTAFRLQTDYKLTPFGGRQTATTSGIGIQTRSRTKTYDDKGRFSTEERDAQGGTERWKYDPVSGYLLWHQGVNAAPESWTLDTFGRLQHGKNGAEGLKGTFAYQYCKGIGDGTTNCPSGAAFLVDLVPDGRDAIARVVNYYDALSRPIATETHHWTGEVVTSRIRYDALMREAERCNPNSADHAMQICQTKQYDAMGRAVAGSVDGKPAFTHVYHGLTDTNASVQGNSMTTVRDGRGRIVEQIVDGTKSTKYVYDGYGNKVQITYPDQRVITFVNDERGNLVEAVSDKGTTRLTYNVLGEPLTMTTPDGRTRTFKTSATRIAPAEVDLADTRF
jgi:YD repeat-containing protein